MQKTFNFFESIFLWCLGFLLAVIIFAITIFYIAPVATGLPVDTSKYVKHASQQINENTQKAHEREVQNPPKPLVESVNDVLNKTVDYLLTFM